jgi:hypothetical protein
MSIRMKLVVAVVASMAALAGATAWLATAGHRRSVEVAARQALAAAGRSLAAMEQGDVEKLGAALAVLAADPRLAAAFERGDREAFLAAAGPIFERLRRERDVTHLYALGLDRRVFVRVHKPDQHGDLVIRPVLSRADQTETQVSGRELGLNGFALRVVEPWRVGGRLVGFLELGEDFEHFLARIQEQTGDEYVLLLSKAGLDERAWTASFGGRRPWGDDPALVVASDTVGAPGLLAGVPSAGLPPEGLLLGEEHRAGRVFARGALPLLGDGGQQAGVLVVLHEVTALEEGLAHARAGVLIALAAVAALLSAVLLWLLQRLVFARLDRMRTSLEERTARFKGGEFDERLPLVPDGRHDELGRFEAFFADFLGQMGALLRDLTDRRRGSGPAGP